MPARQIALLPLNLLFLIQPPLLYLHFADCAGALSQFFFLICRCCTNFSFFLFFSFDISIFRSELCDICGICGIRSVTLTTIVYYLIDVCIGVHYCLFVIMIYLLFVFGFISTANFTFVTKGLVTVSMMMCLRVFLSFKVIL